MMGRASLQYGLGRCEDGLPVLEDGEGDIFSLAVGDEVCGALLVGLALSWPWTAP